MAAGSDASDAPKRRRRHSLEFMARYLQTRFRKTSGEAALRGLVGSVRYGAITGKRCNDRSMTYDRTKPHREMQLSRWRFTFPF